MKTDVSIIYVNYYTTGLLVDSIRSVVNKTIGITYEIIIIDNNSEKNLRQKLQESISDTIPVKYLFLQENIGFGNANNEGAKIASGKYLLFLNPDTILLNNAIKNLYDFMESDPQAGACGGNLYDSSNNPLFSFRKIFPGFIWDFQELTRFVFSYPLNNKKRYFNFSNSPVSVAFVSGANLMIRSDVFFQVKGFPQDFFMYWEDVELCKKIKKKGLEIFNVPKAKICHLESGSFENKNTGDIKKIEFLEKNRLIYLKKNVRKSEFNLSNLLYFLFLQSRYLFLSGHKKSYYKTRKSHFLQLIKNNFPENPF